MSWLDKIDPSEVSEVLLPDGEWHHVLGESLELDDDQLTFNEGTDPAASTLSLSFRRLACPRESVQALRYRLQSTARPRYAE
jgi:hypothetical protein